MEPLNDHELDGLLRDWRAPAPPESLKRKVLGRARGVWWRWLLTGSIRVPVPLTLAVAAAFVALIVLTVLRPASNIAPRENKSTSLQPVKRLEVRIIRSSYESN